VAKKLLRRWKLWMASFDLETALWRWTIVMLETAEQGQHDGSRWTNSNVGEDTIEMTRCDVRYCTVEKAQWRWTVAILVMAQWRWQNVDTIMEMKWCLFNDRTGRGTAEQSFFFCRTRLPKALAIECWAHLTQIVKPLYLHSNLEWWPMAYFGFNIPCFGIALQPSMQKWARVYTKIWILNDDQSPNLVFTFLALE
jgi:hypothetical protein